MIEDKVLQAFLDSAPVLRLERTPLALEPDTLWLVLSGRLDVFLAPTSQDGPAQARRFVLACAAGQTCLGATPQHGKGLIAVSSEGPTEVARLSLKDAPRTPGFQALLEAWLVRLQGVCALGLNAPGRVRRVGAEKPLKVPEGGCMTGFLEGQMIWLPHREGLLELEGQSSTWSRSSAHFPLSKSVWVRSTEALPMQPLATSDWLRTEDVSLDLENFQDLALTLLIRRSDDELQRHCHRLQAKAEQGGVEVSRALHGLSSILDPRRAEQTAAGAGDAMNKVLDVIGRPLGMTIRELVAPSPERSDFSARILGIARSNHLQVRQVRLRDRWWTGGGSPLLGQLKVSGNVVAMICGKSGRYSLYDPTLGSWQAINEEVAGTLEPDAHAFYRTFPARALGLMDILRFGMFGSTPDLVTTLLVLVAAAGLSTLIPILTGVLFGTIIPQSQPHQLIPLVMALVVSALATACFDVTRGLAMLRFQGRSMGNVEAAVWDRLIHLPIAFFRGFSAGSLANRAQALTSILQLLTGLAAGAVMGGIVSLANFGLLFYYDPRLALVATALALTAVAVTLLGGYRNLAYGRTLNELESHLNGVVMQLLAGVSKLRASGAEDRAFSLWAKEFTEVRRYEVAQRKISNWLNVFNAGFPMLATMAIYATVAGLGQDTIDTGKFLAFNAAFGSFFAAFLSMGGSALALLNAVPLFEQAGPILRAVPESDPGKLDPGELTGAIEFSHVGFGYSADGPKVLEDISFKVHPGEYLAVVGPSGAGKSTIARLMLGLEAPSGGTISYDGQDLALLDAQALRRRIGVVLQNVQLLPGSILSAIAGNSSATAEDAWEAARMAGLESDLKALPMGMQTWISEGGGTLSGGQKQRLTIARAIVSRPKILILDEATSALDNQSQAMVTDSLAQMSATRVVIAHRLSTIRDADRILVVESGRVSQQGSYQELSERPGLFRDLVERQVFS